MLRTNFVRGYRNIPVTLTALALMCGASAPAQVCTTENTVTANVVAIDQAFYTNRLGTIQSGGMIFALERDVVSNNGSPALTCGQRDASGR